MYLNKKQLDNVAKMSSNAALGGTSAAMFTSAAAVVTTVLILFIFCALGVSLWAYLRARMKEASEALVASPAPRNRHV